MVENRPIFENISLGGLFFKLKYKKEFFKKCPN